MTRNELVEKMISANVTGGMYAALSVAAEEILGPLTLEENYFSCGLVSRFLASRRSLYRNPKSAEERVTIRETCEHWCVCVDGITSALFLKDRYTKQFSETYCLGLIQQLKELPHDDRSQTIHNATNRRTQG